MGSATSIPTLTSTPVQPTFMPTSRPVPPTPAPTPTTRQVPQTPALRAHTLGAAYAMHEEKIKGLLEVGKLADLAVWNEDPYSAADHIGPVTIAMTLVGGKVVYQAA